MSLLTVPLGGVLIGYLARYDGAISRKTVQKIMLGSLAAVAVCTLLCALGGFVGVRLLYPAQFDAVSGLLLICSLSEVFYFITGVLAVIVLRFGKRRYQLYINGAFALAFFALGIPATLFFGIYGFAVSTAIAALLRWIIAVLCCHRCVTASH